MSYDDGLASHAILPGKRFTDKWSRPRYGDYETARGTSRGLYQCKKRTWQRHCSTHSFADIAV